MSESVENARKFLDSLQRHDLSKLLTYSEVESGVGNAGSWFETGVRDAGSWFETYVIVRSPRPFAEAISVLAPHDKKRIAEAVVSDEGGTTAPNQITSSTLEGPAIEGLSALLPELIIHRQMMISVATGGDRIQEVEDYYRSRQMRLNEICKGAGIEYLCTFESLWDWYKVWNQSLPSWAERRHYINDIFKKPIALASIRSATAVEEREPTGWERVDRTLSKARNQIGIATAEEDYQAIGLLCREIMISLAQAVYDPAVHVSLDGVKPSANDANRMIEAYVHYVFPGDSYKEVRAHARAAMALSLNLQHRRTATKQLAELCLEAATSAAAVISIISDRQGQP